MSLFDATERMLEVDRLNVSFDPTQCLHSISRLSKCEACFEVCPVDAIQPEKPPAFDKDLCVDCMACIPICPVGAFDAIDALPALLKCAARSKESKVELICSNNSHPEAGPEASQMAIRIRGCLAGIGSSAYLGLTILGKKEIFLRLEDCDNCVLGTLKKRILHQVTLARNLLSSQVEQIFTIIKDHENINLVSNRSLWEADNPPISRRDLFRLASQTEDLSLANTLSKTNDIQGQTPGRERLRLNTALDQLGNRGLVDQASSLEGFHYALLSIHSDCSACGVCARACPTGALHFKQHESRFRLEFSPLECIDCAICQQVCTEDAIKISHNPTVSEICKQDRFQRLIEGDLSRCARCNVLFSPKQDEVYCPTCNYRMQHPFGSRMPPGFHSKNKNDA